MTITIEVLAGLANRIRSLVSAICLAKDHEETLHVIWPANDPACMIRFYDLFEKSSFPKWVQIDMGPLEGKSFEIQTEDDFTNWLSSSPRLPMKSHQPFYKYESEEWLQVLRNLKPVQEIRSKLSHPFLEKQCVGVHIRRGDHQLAKKFSPLDLFIEKMKEESQTTNFIIATDSAAVKRDLQAMFGDRVWFPADSLSRMTRNGMQSALVDFLALSTCSKILGSYDSSFSKIASLYGNVPLLVIKTSQE
jgi:hypothetical protein